MLDKAKKKAEKEGWSDAIFFQADARTLSPELLLEHTQEQKVDRIICALGLSVIPEWEKVLDNLLELLAPNGKIVIVDVFAEKRTFNTWLVEKIAKADLNREIAKALESKTSNFQLEYMPVKPSKVGGRLFVASGIKAV